MKKNLVIIILSIISITSLVINFHLNKRLNEWEEIDINEIKSSIRQDYIDDIKMLCYQIIYSNSHYDSLEKNFSKVHKNFMVLVKPKGEYGWLELNNLSFEFDSLGYANRIYLENDSIIRN